MATTDRLTVRTLYRLLRTAVPDDEFEAVASDITAVTDPVATV